MTKEEKRDRREARKQVEQIARRNVIRRIGLFATTAQIKAATRVVADQAFKEMTRAAR